MEFLLVLGVFCLSVGACAGLLVAALAFAASRADDAMDVWDLDEEDLP